MIFELWDTESANIVGAWENEDEALAVVRASLEAYGPAYIERWALLRDDDPDSDLVMIAEGTDLATKARSALSAA